MAAILKLYRPTRVCSTHKGFFNVMLLFILIILTLQLLANHLSFNKYEFFVMKSKSKVKDIHSTVCNYIGKEKFNFTNDSLTTIQFEAPSLSFQIPDVVPSKIANLHLPLCPAVSPLHVGVMSVEQILPSVPEQEKIHKEVESGGKFHPKDCRARHRVALIIPFRDREEHLPIVVHNIHEVLQNQQLDYAIFVIEQAGKEPFNKGLMMNVGTREALKRYPFQCFIFHDVDLIPENDYNLYTCPKKPRHMSVAISTLKYKLPYKTIFGGVIALTVEQFEKVNGFSNQFLGWGGEDDDMLNRVRYHGYNISRYPGNIARYTMLIHKKEPKNPTRYSNLKDGKKRYKYDGLIDVKDRHRVLDIQERRLYTWIYVNAFPI